MPLISQQRIGEDDELSHDRCQGDLGRLSRPEQGLVLGFQIRIEAGRHQRRHIQRLTHMSATTADRAQFTLQKVSSDRVNNFTVRDPLLLLMR